VIEGGVARGQKFNVVLQRGLPEIGLDAAIDAAPEMHDEGAE
jgi:hypothetical protein